jgi:hypothetical protein
MKKILSFLAMGIMLFSCVTARSDITGDGRMRGPSFPFPAEPHEKWNRTFGGVYPDEGWAVHQTFDGGFIMVGYTASYGGGNSDIWLIKTDSDGYRIWDKTYGGPGSDFSRSVQQTSDGGYIIGGTTDSYGNGDYDFFVIKTDAYGTPQWQKTFGGSNEDHCQAVQQLSSGDYILTGDWDLGGTSDLCLMKIDSEGNELWSKLFSGEHFGFSTDIQITPDGGFIIAGSIDLSGNTEMWLLRTDATGTQIWEKTFGTAVSDIATSVHLTSDNGFLLGGWTLPSNLSKSMVLVKTDENGTMLWEKRFPIGQSTEPYVNTLGIDETYDRGYILVGEKIVSTQKDVWIIKTDVDGTPLWNITLGGSSYDYGSGVEQIDAGNYIVVGSTDSFGAGNYNVWLIKFSSGNETQPPGKPLLSGQSAGTAGEEYTFTGSTTDPDGDDVQYIFDWGDRNASGWLGPYESGALCTASHTWSKVGTYPIRVKAKDMNGAESSWSDPVNLILTSEVILEIVSIHGGLGVTIDIKNRGEKNASDVNVSFEISGGLFIFPRTGFQNTALAVGESKTIRFRILGVGLGLLISPPVLTVFLSAPTAPSVEQSTDAKIIGPIILIPT